MNDDTIVESSSVLLNTQLFKALGDDTRLKMVGLLSHGELCVCDLMAVLELPQSTASRHLAYLKNSHWVTGRRSGRWMYYKLNPAILRQVVYRSIIEFIEGLAEVQREHAVLREYLRQKDASQCI